MESILQPYFPPDVDNSTGWPWYAAKIPPSDFYDCLFLYYSCTDFETPGKKSSTINYAMPVSYSHRMSQRYLIS